MKLFWTVRETLHAYIVDSIEEDDANTASLRSYTFLTYNASKLFIVQRYAGISPKILQLLRVLVYKQKTMLNRHTSMNKGRVHPFNLYDDMISQHTI